MAWIVRIAKQAVFNLDAIWSIWALHDRQSSMINPKNFVFVYAKSENKRSESIYLLLLCF